MNDTWLHLTDRYQKKVLVPVNKIVLIEEGYTSRGGSLIFIAGTEALMVNETVEQIREILQYLKDANN